MRQLSPSHNQDLRTGYATEKDFCQVFHSHMKHFYLLAFLLTGNHQAAEQCIAAAVDESFEQASVFKGWVRSWFMHCVVKNAIRCSAELPRGGRSESWSVERDKQLPLVDGVTSLPRFERLVFVLSILEGYSIRKCSVLLNCGLRRVVHARLAAMRQLARTHPVLIEEEVTPTPFATSSVSHPRFAEGGPEGVRYRFTTMTTISAEHRTSRVAEASQPSQAPIRTSLSVLTS